MVKRKAASMAIFLIIILAALIRISGINIAVFFEEATWTAMAGEHSFSNLGMTYPSLRGLYTWPHPPVSVIMYKSATLAFGLYTYTMRMVPVIFGILSIIMVYLLCRKFLDMRTALIATILIAFSYWHVLASLEIDIDGGILTFLFLALAYSFLRFESSSEKKWLITTGIIFGLSLLTKYTSFIFVLFLLTYVVAKKVIWKNSLRKEVLSLVYIGVIGLLVFSIFPLASFLTNSSSFLKTISHSSGYASLFHPTIRPLIYLFVFGTPLYIGLALLAALYFRKGMKPIHLFLILWILVPLILYSVFLGPKNAEGPYEKYLMILIPPMVMLAGTFLSRISFKKRDIYAMATVFLVSFSLIYLSNLQPARYIDHDMNSYIINAASLKWDFNFPIMANTEPGFYVNFYSLAAVSILSIILIAATAVLMIKNKNFKQILIIFIAVGFAFNLFFLQEFLTSSTHPSISKSVYEMVDYYKGNNLTGPIYTNALSFAFYLNKTDSNLYFFVMEDENDEFDTAKQHNATMIIGEYYPNVPKTSTTWKKLTECTLLKKFTDKNVTLGYIFSC